MGGVELKRTGRTHDLLAQITSGPRLLQGLFKTLIGFEDFAVDVVVTHANAHGIGSNGHPLDHDVGVELQNVAVFEGTGLAFVGIAHQVFGTWELARHEAPLQAGGKTGTATPAQARLFDDGDHLILRQAFRAILAQYFAQRLIAATRLIVLQVPIAAVQTGQNLRLNVPSVEAGLQPLGLKLGNQLLCIHGMALSVAAKRKPSIS